MDSSGNVYVVDTGNNRIQKFDADGIHLLTWGTKGDKDGEFERPLGAAEDAAGNIYVADSDNARIQKFDSSGKFLSKWGSSGSNSGEFQNPDDLAVDTDNNIYVADEGSSRLQKFDSSGAFVGDSNSTTVDLGQTAGLATSAAGFIYVSDISNQVVQQFASDTFSLDDAVPDDNDGIPSRRTFDLPAGSYSFSETLPNGWSLSGVSCDSGSWKAFPADKSVTVNLSPSENIICAFANKSAGAAGFTAYLPVVIAAAN